MWHFRCFANGRHSRLIADVIIDEIFGGEVLHGGGQSLIQGRREARAAYLKALKAADQRDYELLIKFARS